MGMRMEEQPNPVAEAIQIFGRVLNDLSSPNRDLTLVLRSCLHACRLANLHEAAEWFRRELSGYQPEAELPWYRRGYQGALEWRTESLGGSYSAAAIDAVSGRRIFPADETLTTDIYEGVTWMQDRISAGQIERTGRTERRRTVRGEPFTIYERRHIYPGVYKGVLARIEELTFDFTSKTYTTLRYSDALHDVWQSFRAAVELQLQQLGLEKHLMTIQKGLQSTNPQDWRAVLWSCRDVLHDLAGLLWRDPRETYIHLPGNGPDGKLRVTGLEFVNRLGAYMHQKGITGTAGQYLRSEMDRIYGSIDGLNKLASGAHGGATYLDACTAALGTYFVLGELVQRTDLVPVTTYSEKAPQGPVQP